MTEEETKEEDFVVEPPVMTGEEGDDENGEQANDLNVEQSEEPDEGGELPP